MLFSIFFNFLNYIFIFQVSFGSASAYMAEVKTNLDNLHEEEIRKIVVKVRINIQFKFF